MAPFYGWGSIALRLQKKKKRKAESTIELPNGLEHGTSPNMAN